MNPPCGRCNKPVYPTEKINCLDKYWHKGCFSCEVCKMALSMTTYKGFEKKPYCSMHYPKTSFTIVADTPENLRLKQQSMLNSQALYKEDFEKNKGKGFSVVVDTPEMQRVKKTQDQISHVRLNKGKGFSVVVDTPEMQRVKKTQDQISNDRKRSQSNNMVVDLQTGALQQAETGAERNKVLQPAGKSSDPAETHFRHFSSSTEGQLPYMVKDSQLWTQSEHYEEQPSNPERFSQPVGQMCPAAVAPPGGGKRYQAVYSYVAAEADEVSLQEGDLLLDVEPIDEGWMFGCNQRTGQRGMLPANYVRPV
ncbi:hypothetical protein FQN60_002877 [Etheostoma spectabile]|uniref:LIM and SH3 domain protein 1 n=1 Tax=Etheostoma spectabile TaxID=54343 RepID=A0A5J5CL42_9PERO|nr:hypothetical protein FQN60_002877 [Etheostoma spectabile]